MIYRMGKQVSAGLEHIGDITVIFFIVILRENEKKCAVHEVIAEKIIHFLSHCRICCINNKFCLGQVQIRILHQVRLPDSNRIGPDPRVELG